MACKTSCQLCPRLVLTTGVTFDATSNTLNLSIPETSYRNGDKVCIVIAQAIPTTTTISALVYVFVGGTSAFQLVRCNGGQVTANELRTRTRYSTHVVTNTVSGVFKLDGKVCACVPSNLDILPVA